MMQQPTVVVRNTFLEVGDHEGLSERIEGWRRQVSEPAAICSSSFNCMHEQTQAPRWGEMESDDEFNQPYPAGTYATLPMMQTGSQVGMGCCIVSPDQQIIMVPQEAFNSFGGASADCQDWSRQGNAANEPQSRQNMTSRRNPKVQQSHDGYSNPRRGKEEVPVLRRTRDVHLSGLKDEAITRQEPPWTGVTTVMMRNLPNKYTQQMLLSELHDAGFKIQEDFDFFYLPMDHNNCANLGYCFINFTATDRANDFAAIFNGKKMRRFNSNKTAVIMPASIQGYERNHAYYVSTRVSQAADPQYRPLFLKPESELQSGDVDGRSAQNLDQQMVQGGKAAGGTGSRERRATRERRTSTKDSWEEMQSSSWAGSLQGSPMMQPQVQPMQMEQDMRRRPTLFCTQCGQSCGTGYRFCAFCGHCLVDSSDDLTEAPTMMMMTPVFHPTMVMSGNMLAPTIMALAPMPQMAHNVMPDQQMPMTEVRDNSEQIKPEALDILHGRMMLLAALKEHNEMAKESSFSEFSKEAQICGPRSEASWRSADTDSRMDL